MTEFWETAFREKHEMWGFNPCDSAIVTLDLFRKYGIKKILVPGFGYGRNAKIFIENGFDVTGIEISETAIALAKKYYGNDIKVHHGSVTNMPFDQELYDGIFCYALIHLLNAEDRIKLIHDCFNQLSPGGYMIFVAISKIDPRYGKGKEISRDTFETKHGIALFFYDSDSIKAEFGNYGLIEAKDINESSQKFWFIKCKKETI